jgi:hypothetical protein
VDLAVKYGSGFKGSRVQGFKVQGSRFKVQGSKFRVARSELAVPRHSKKDPDTPGVMSGSTGDAILGR